MQKSLFGDVSEDSQKNLLPKDGAANYYPHVIDPVACNQLFSTLTQSLAWQQDQLIMYGKKITMQRKVAWVGDAGCTYTYSGVQKNPAPWTPEILRIKSQMEDLAACKFNACLLNLYHHGQEGMGWHSDNEKELDPHAPIASFSLGGTRKFAFKHKLDQTGVSLFLENGSVLIMHAPTQDFWNHSLMKTAREVDARINLTFRALKLG